MICSRLWECEQHSERDRIRSINGMFGGLQERYHNREEAFETACDLLTVYFGSFESSQDLLFRSTTL